VLGCYPGQQASLAVGAPILALEALYMLKLIRHMRALQGRRSCFGWRHTALSPERLKVRLQYLTERYAIHAPYWQFVLWARQLAMIGISVAFETYDDTVMVLAEAAATVAVLVATLVLHWRTKPYAHHQNVAELVLGSFSILAVAVGYVVYVSRISQASVPIGVFQVSLLGMLLGPVSVYVVWLSVGGSRREATPSDIREQLLNPAALAPMGESTINARTVGSAIEPVVDLAVGRATQAAVAQAAVAQAASDRRVSSIEEAGAVLVQAVGETQQRVAHIEAWTRVPQELLLGVVCVGIAAALPPANYPGRPTVTVGGITYVVIALGTGWFFDRRGLVFTCEHVRRNCRRLLSQFGGGELVACPQIAGEPNWQAHAWRATALAHTGHWNGSAPQPTEIETDTSVVVLPTPTDVAVLRVYTHLATGVAVDNPVRMPTGDAPIITTLELGNPATLLAAAKVFVLGFPPIGGRSMTPSSAEFCNTKSDSHGRWLMLKGLMSEGHSGGPVVAQQQPSAGATAKGAVVGWNVRTILQVDGAAGLVEARPIDVAHACMDAARQHPSLPADVLLLSVP